MKSKGKPRIGSLHSLPLWAGRILSASIHYTAKQQKKADEAELIQRKHEEETERVRAINELSRSPGVHARRKLLDSYEKETPWRNKTLAHTKRAHRIIRSGRIIGSSLLNFRTTKTGKAIRIATGGPKLWARTWKVRKTRRRNK